MRDHASALLNDLQAALSGMIVAPKTDTSEYGRIALKVSAFLSAVSDHSQPLSVALTQLDQVASAATPTTGGSPTQTNQPTPGSTDTPPVLSPSLDRSS